MPDTCLQRTDTHLAAIDAAGEQGRCLFTRLYADGARAAATAADARRAVGVSLGPLDGRVVTIKDLFDVAGEPTTAGSAVLRDAPPATADAAVVQRLRAAGAVILGKTNMTEFAFSGIGINPHWGTPGNAADPTRIPGGSSSGAGVAVARGFCEIAIGSDTGGSVRIPAALNGVTGFKPSLQRVPREGAFPLSYTLDALGPLARSIADCVAADAVLTGTPLPSLPARSVRGLRVGVPRGLLLTRTEATVEAAFETVLKALATAGARVDDVDLESWITAPFSLQEAGTLVAAEAAEIHAGTLATRPEALDPLVLARIRRGESITARHYVGVQRARQRLMAELDLQLADLDVLVLPTVAFTAPLIAQLANDPEAFNSANLLALRNTSVFNFYDLPAVSLPIRQPAGALPVGLMVVGRRLQDRSLLAVATALQGQVGPLMPG